MSRVWDGARFELAIPWPPSSWRRIISAAATPRCLRKSVRKVRVRSANRADIPAMIALNHQSPTAAQWSVQQYESLFPDSDPQLSPRVILVAEDDSSSETPSAAASDRHRILAFLVARQMDTQWELENIVVGAGSRRRGLGSRLLGDLIKQARTKDANSIFLEVRQS